MMAVSFGPIKSLEAPTAHLASPLINEHVLALDEPRFLRARHDFSELRQDGKLGSGREGLLLGREHLGDEALRGGPVEQVG